MAMKPYYAIRAMGGVLYIAGALIMVYNFWRTIRGDVNEKELQQLQVQGAAA